MTKSYERPVSVVTPQKFIMVRAFYNFGTVLYNIFVR